MKEANKTRTIYINGRETRITEIPPNEDGSGPQQGCCTAISGLWFKDIKPEFVQMDNIDYKNKTCHVKKD